MWFMKFQYKAFVFFLLAFNFDYQSLITATISKGLLANYAFDIEALVLYYSLTIDLINFKFTFRQVNHSAIALQVL